MELLIVRGILISKYIPIEGTIEISDKEDIDEITDKFNGFIELNGWYFGDGFKEVDKEGIDIWKYTLRCVVHHITPYSRIGPFGPRSGPK